jgi:hypothetical protein
MTQLSIRALAVCTAMVSGMVPGPAWSTGPTMHEITWAHSNPAGVGSFVIFVADVKGDTDSARRIAIPKPSGGQAGSIQTFSAIVPMVASEYVAVAAVGYDGQMGGLSAWSAPPPTQPGQPFVVEP